LVALALQCLLLAVAPQAASADDKTEARALFGQGVEAFGAGKFDAALRAFSEAYRLAPHPSVRVNMANCFRELGKPVEALFNFERFISESGDGAQPERLAEVRNRIAELQKQIGYLKFQVKPSSAQVLVNGQPAHPDANGRVVMAVGRHEVRISAAGHDTEERRLRVRAGKTTVADIKLQRGAPALVETSTDEPTPSEEPPEPSDGSEQEASEFSLDSPRPEPLAYDRLTFGLSTPVLLTGGGAVVLAITATITGVMALGAQADFEAAVDTVNNTPPGSPQQERAQEEGYDHASRADTLAAVTDVLIGAAVVSACAAGALWWLDRPDQPGSQGLEEGDDSELELSKSLVLPWASSKAAGLSLHGSF